MAFTRENKATTIPFNAINSVRMVVGIILICLIAFMFTGPAQAFSFTFSPQIPQCSDPKVEARIFKDFRWSEKKTWQRGVDLVSMSRLHEHRTVLHEGSIVTRRYCMARAHLSNGKKRSLYYMINDRGGFAGVTWKVTHCIIGLDPWKNHDGNCLAIR
jgi:hypothetical protein